MSLARGLAEGELERLIVLLSRADPREKNPFLALVRGAREAAVTHVRMEPQTEKDSADEAKQAARMYFLGIAHVREIFSGTGAIVNFNVTKRWIQSIFNHLSDDEAFVNGLTNIKNFDEYTFNHSVNVSVLSLAIGRRLNLSPHELSELGLAAFLHDLGKVEIPSEILNKPGRLDAEEKAIMEGHSRLGAQRLLQLKIERGLPNLAIQVALEHHLKPDLGGYPKYQKKRRIALYSKIVKIADVFDALTTKRVYRPKAFTREETLAMMMAKSGDEFDPILLKVFANMIGVYPIGSLVVLSTGEIGVVCEANPQPVFTKRPKVKLITDRAGNMHDGDVVDLTEIDPETRAFARSIVKTLDPEKYGLDVSRFFLARAS
jgi:HD-GYP domain-containing protein (c-di-GMP phosphodiesterase class II)